MFKTKKEVDLHVRTALAKLRSENEKKLRSFTIAKLYFKINEYSAAEEYVSSYLTIKDDNDQAYKLLGQCYLYQKKTSKALASFQRSLQLNPKQPDLLGEVCQILIDDKSLNIDKAKYWCDLAESEKVQHDSVFSLRLKLMNKNNLEINQVEEFIQKEISSRPQDVNLRIRLVRHLLEQNKVLEAFQNTYQLEMVNHGMLAQSAEWYNVLWLVLSKYEQIPNAKKDWQFWLLVVTCLERQVHLSFTSNSNLPNNGSTETANLLFSFDQYLYKVSQIIHTLNQQKEFVTRFMEHYQGQLCLHAASLIFKRELIQNKNKWKETIKTSLPLLMLAYQSTRPDSKEQWMKHLDEHGTLLLQQWNREGAFRCVQAGRTLVACIEENNENRNHTNNMIENSSPWTTPEALVSQIRQLCTDKNWRRGIFGQLFCNSDQKVKESTSHLIKCVKLSEPIYELPTYAELEQYEETAQYLNPQSLQHMVYLCLGNDNLANVRVKFFNGLNFSTHNLSFCGAESLNQLDIDTFLYAATLQFKSVLDMERKAHECYHPGIVPKPKVLPFVNMQSHLCTDDQISWWMSAYQVYKNLANDNLAEIRATLQYGIEALRGINGPKMDLLIIFKLGKIFENRSVDINKPVERGMVEARAENLYKCGLSMLKMSNKGVLEPFKRYFTNANAKSSSAEREVSVLAEEAVSFLAAKYFKKSEYEELIDELSGIQLPFATYFQSEAYRRLDEAMKTPKKNKRVYLDKANECLNQTLHLLKNTQVDPNHPLNAVIPFELKNLQQNKNKFINEQCNNSSSYEDAETEFGLGELTANNRSRRENSTVSPRTIELENMVRQIKDIVENIKTEIIENIKPEIVEVHTQLKEIKERLNLIEENMPKKSITPSRDEEASNVLDDLYIIEDELQNQMYSNQQQHQQQQMNMYGQSYPQQHSVGQRMHTPTAAASGGVVNVQGPAGMNPYNSPLYGNYAMNYYAQQLMMPPQLPAAPVMGTHSSQLSNRNALGLSYMDSAMNFNMPGLNPSMLMPTTSDSRSSNLFGLLNQNATQQPQLGPPIQQQPPPNQPALPAPPLQSIIPAPPLQSINLQPKFQSTAPQIAPPSNVIAPPSGPITFNKSLNNAPVEKGPPVNVVITSSDPLPTTSSSMQPQPTLSVTIPSHHIKSSLVSTNDLPKTQPANTNFPMMGPISTMTTTASITSPFTMKFPTPLTTTTTATTITTGSPISFSFKPPPQNNTDSLNKTNESNTSDLHKSEHEVEYDPRPDFQPIIPLPDEIEVKTGEENEEVMFSSRSKLFRFADKEWKERGVGDMKILKNKENGTSRILMRRDQTHKICANHRITSELNLTKPKGTDKGFIWAANDFADEELKLEKFLVRFKLAETEKQFEAAFNVARNEASELSKAANGNLNSKPKSFGLGLPKTFAENKTSTPTQNKNGNTKSSVVAKPLFEGFPVKKIEEPKTQKSSPFANFSFDNTTSPVVFSGEPKPFANLFANINTNAGDSQSATIASEPKQAESKPENHNKSDNEDEYVPTAQFQPVIPLPDLVEVTTGEENEIVLFEHRAKLLRFDKTTSEWKERGLGNIKVLQDQNDVNNVRLVMRRETIHKLCCNQRLYKDTNFKYAKNSKTALMWAGQDFSENELQPETLTVRFKTADSCTQFLNVITEAQAKMTTAANEENAKNTEPLKTKSEPAVEKSGFGDKFKPKAGSWACDQCYTSNTADKLYCASCEAPKDDTVPKKNILGTSTTTLAKPAFSFGFGNSAGIAAAKSFVATEAIESAKQQVGKAPTVGFGDKFKPKEGSWACEQCYTSNTAEKQHCASCEAPKDKTVPKKETKSLIPGGDVKSEFSFGFAPVTQKPSSETTSIQENVASILGFGDKFKPKAGSWSCSECYLLNSGDVFYCKACNSPKDSTVPKKEPVDILALSNPSAKFSFGIQPATNTGSVKSDTQTFTFGKPNLGEGGGGGVSGGFKFGIPKEEEGGNKATNIFNTNTLGNALPTNLTSSKLGEAKSFSFAPATTVSTESTSSTVTATTGTISKSTFAFTLPSQTNEPSGGDKAAVGSSFSLDKKNFSFVMKPKSPGKGKSPQKPINSPVAATEEDEDGVAEEEENNTYFTPVIPLPDKIEVKTGEEDEEVVYSYRAKLFRFTEGEWKERGLGDVKILRHKQTKKLRVVMRREQVLKICLNHALNEDVIYKNKDEKSWLFVVNDYSEGEMKLNNFCLRFRSKDIADAFMKAVKDCLEELKKPTTSTEQVQESDVSSSNLQTKEVNISDESKRIADRLMLPYSFFDISSIVDCPGCRGCDPDNFVFPNYPPPSTTPNDSLPLNMTSLALSTPKYTIPKPSKFSNDFSTPKTEPDIPEVNSIFGGNLMANTTTTQNDQSTIGNFSFTQAMNSTTKENEKPVSGGFIFGGQEVTGSNIFGGKATFGSSSILGGTTAQSNGTSLFGNMMNKTKSVFDNTLFGGQQQQIGGDSQSKTDKTEDVKENFSNAKVTFGQTVPPLFGSKPSFGTSSFGDFQKYKQQPIIQESSDDSSSKNVLGESLFSASSNALSFKALAEQSKAAPITTPSQGFIGLTHTNAFSSFKNVSDDAEHDPHFEPIIALPDEITVSTGEEDEDKIFGERTTLYRYDKDNKEWKERGVGELRILQHKTKGTYRMVMRREQIFKLVLNHAVGADFSFNNMGNNPRAFIWGTLNYAEEGDGVLEKLSCRFRNLDSANKFKDVLEKCIETAKNRAGQQKED